MIFSGGGPTSSALGQVSPQLDLWSDSFDVGWALVSILFGVPSGP